jgi:hypothetical protein
MTPEKMQVYLVEHASFVYSKQAGIELSLMTVVGMKYSDANNVSAYVLYAAYFLGCVCI